MPIGQSQTICQCKWRHLVANFKDNISSATWWPNLEVVQMTLLCGQVSIKLMQVVAKFVTNEISLQPSYLWTQKDLLDQPSPGWPQ